MIVFCDDAVIEMPAVLLRAALPLLLLLKTRGNGTLSQAALVNLSRNRTDVCGRDSVLRAYVRAMFRADAKRFIEENGDDDVDDDCLSSSMIRIAASMRRYAAVTFVCL